MPERAPRFEGVGGAGGTGPAGGGADPGAAERRAQQGAVPDVDEETDEGIELEPARAPRGPRFKRSRVIAPQDVPGDATSGRGDESRDLSPTAELIARRGTTEDLERGEQAIEERAAEGDVFAQTFEGGTAIQEAGAAAAEELRKANDPTPGDVGSRAAAIGVGGAGFAAGLPGQAVGAAGVAGAEGAERVLTDETVESIGVGGSRQSRAFAEEPVASGVAVAAPSGAVRAARAGAPRVRAGAETLATEFSRGGRSRGQLQIGRQTGRQDGGTVREITAEDLSGQRATADIRGPTERLVPGARGQDLQAATGFDIARFGDPVTSGRTGTAARGRAPAEASALTGADSRREQAQELTIDAGEQFEAATESETATPTTQTKTQTLDEAARERQVSTDAVAERSVAGLESQERARTEQRERAAAATTADIADRAAIAERPTTTTTTTGATTQAEPAPAQPPRVPRRIAGDGDGDDGDGDDRALFDLIGQENIFPARDPITGPEAVLEEAGFE